MAQYISKLECLDELARQVWRRRLRILARCKDITLQMMLQLEAWHEQVETLADQSERQNAARKQKDYKDFLQQGSEGAAGLIHRLSKPMVTWQLQKKDQRVGC